MMAKQKVLEYLKKNKICSVTEVARAVGISRNTARFALLELLADGKIKRKKINMRSYVYIYDSSEKQGGG